MEPKKYNLSINRNAKDVHWSIKNINLSVNIKYSMEEYIYLMSKSELNIDVRKIYENIKL